MAGLPRPNYAALRREYSRRREARRRIYFWRRIAAALILLGLLAGLYFGIDWLLTQFAGLGAEPRPEGSGKPVTAGAASPLPYKAEYFLPVPDLDSDGLPEQVAVGPADGSLRQIALITGDEKAPKIIGEPITVPDFRLAVRNLPEVGGVLVLEGSQPISGKPQPVTIGKETALEAAGGEPDYRAWRPDLEQGLVAVDYYALVAPAPPAPTAIVVDKWLNALWYYEDGKLVQTARVSTGRHIDGPQPTAANQLANMVTPTGTYTIANKHPGLPYYREDLPAGDPRNPLGTRWMGFSVYQGDNGMVWAIHGTNEPTTIGLWNSKGSIRMGNEAIEALYERVQVGTILQVVASGKP